ncbi:hypothetical protein PTKIN_Ptkin06aG0053400 [Pterospermum kingtungense]
MFKEIRHYVINKIVEQQRKCGKWNTVFLPRICEIIENNKEISSFCHVKWNGAMGYEVQCNQETFVVRVQERKCTCRRWDLIGIPCAHAICVILFRKEKIEDHVATCYRKEIFQALYNCILFPLPGINFGLIQKWEK